MGDNVRSGKWQVFNAEILLNYYKKIFALEFEREKIYTLARALFIFAKIRKKHALLRFQLSWADLLWAAYSEYLSVVLAADPNKDHPELKKLVEKVRALPNIKAYLEKRPKTQL